MEHSVSIDRDFNDDFVREVECMIATGNDSHTL